MSTTPFSPASAAAPQPASPSGPRDRAGFSSPTRRLPFAAGVLGVLALWALVRLALFIGYQGHDDRTYIAYAWLFAHGGNIAARGLVDPWVGRMGAWLPMAGFIRLFGGTEWALVGWSVLTSFASLALLLAFGRRSFGERVALLAGVLFAVLPIDVVYATRAFGDEAVGFWCVAALLAFWTALSSPGGSRGWAIVTGLCFGVAYLTKETALLMALPFGVIALLARQQQQPSSSVGRVCVGVIAGFAIAVAVEWLFWGATSGDPLYRWHSTLKVKDGYVPPRVIGSWFDWIPSPIPSEIFRSNNTLIDAALMLLTNEEWGFLYYLALPLAVWSLFRGSPVGRALAVFVVGMLLLLLFTPLHFPNYTLGRDPRFFTMLSVPALLLLADAALRLAPFWRRAVIGFLVVTWLPCLYVGYVSSNLSTERQVAQFVKSHPQDRFWMNSVAACDAIVLSGFDPAVDIGVIAIRGGRVTDAPGLIASNPARALREKLPLGESLAALAGQWVLVPSGVSVPPQWSLEREFTPAPDALSLAVRRALSGVLPAALVAKIAPSQGHVMRLYRA